ncbi:MAG: hypothetical protein R3277_03675 [Brumimicrobium sp.]|nr:hypothetical protein [Brumimicrobium sp.]
MLISKVSADESIFKMWISINELLISTNEIWLSKDSAGESTTAMCIHTLVAGKSKTSTGVNKFSAGIRTSSAGLNMLFTGIYSSYVDKSALWYVLPFTFTDAKFRRCGVRGSVRVSVREGEWVWVSSRRFTLFR